MPELLADAPCHVEPRHVVDGKDAHRHPEVGQRTVDLLEHILKTYNLHANCYITKPVDLEQFISVVKSIDDFWLTVVRLPAK